MHKLDGKMTPVSYTFFSPKRAVFMVLLSIGVLFLPVILALLINGFNFARLNLGGSAVWFCIAVPVVPIYLVRFGIQWLYENPWIYIFTENGKRKRYWKKPKTDTASIKETLKICIGLFIAPPFCFITWAFIAIVYFTAFSF